MTTMPLFRELIVDCFAGGGGASLGIEQALGRKVDIAINHDPIALAIHRKNHPDTEHYIEDVFKVDPVKATKGMPVGLAWFSPDCTHHSKAKGGKPRSNKRRGLAWVVVRWAKRVRPRIIALENVEEFQDWGPLDEHGHPCNARKGATFDHWCEQLKRLGYAVEYKLLKASDYGAPTTRTRLFLIARRDGQPIQWPKPSHGSGRTQQPVRTAAECIDWTIPAPSIFERSRPLADATCHRVAAGVFKFVVYNPDPFILTIDHQGSKGDCVHLIGSPLNTITTKARHCLVTPFLTKFYGTSTGARVDGPCPTITAGGQHIGLVSAWIAKHYTGVTGQDCRKPLGTITTVDHHSLVTAFLIKYYGNEQSAHSVEEPLGTITCTDRFGLVTVHGEQYRIVDIGLRMLQPHELAAAQGFPTDYIIDDVDTTTLTIAPGKLRWIERHGGKLSNKDQVRLIGNSVSPYPAAALIKANMAVKTQRRIAA